MVAAEKAATATASGEQQPAVERVEAASPQVLLQLKVAASPGTQQLVLRKSASKAHRLPSTHREDPAIAER
eukprot:2151296-Prymnesium_polylepis.1